MENVEGKTPLQMLGLDRNEDWTASRAGEAQDFLCNHAEVMDRIVISFCLEIKDLEFILLIKGAKRSYTLAQLLELVFLVGYMKGVAHQEDTVRLEKLME